VKAAKAAKKKGKGKQKVRKEHVPKCILVLRFKTFGNVRNYTNDEDNWPGNWSEVDTEYEEEAKDHREYYRRNTPDANIQLPIEDPNGLVDDITGYPSARGCKQCRADGKDCTMTEGGTFPCDECKDEDVLCEPIIKPVTKGRCTQCAHDDQDTCSFEDDPERGLATTTLQNTAHLHRRDLVWSEQEAHPVHLLPYREETLLAQEEDRQAAVQALQEAWYWLHVL
jgi:hypothetical protein